MSKLYLISEGTTFYNRENYKVLSFSTFQELVEYYQNNRSEVLANDASKKASSWISSEICSEGKRFNQSNFSKNGGLAIIDFDNTIPLLQVKEKIVEYNYYIFNTTKNGKNNQERFRLILPLDKKLKSKEEVKSLYLSLDIMFGETADKSKLAPCIPMAKPQHWQSTIQGIEANNNVKVINETCFAKDNICVDNILKDYPYEESTYKDRDTKDKDKICSIKQNIAIQEAKKNFLILSRGRHNAFYNLAVKLHSYGLEYNEVAQHLEEVKFNRKNPNKPISETIKGIEKNPSSVNPSVFKDIYHREYIIDKKVEQFLQVKNPIILNEDNKISDLKDFQTSEIFTDNGVNLLDSPTNSGKTFYVINEYKNYIADDEYIVVFVPYITLANEIKQSYLAYTLQGDDEFDIDRVKEKKVVVATYNKLYQLLKNQNGEFNFNKCHIFIDEAHNLYASHSYRHDILNRLHEMLIVGQLYKKLILMSGTFNTSYFKDSFIKNKVSVKREKTEIVKECFVIETTQSIANSAVSKTLLFHEEDKNRLQIFYYNDKKKAKEVGKKLEDNGLKVLHLNSDTKNNEELQEIYRTNLIPTDINVLLMTKIGEEGLSFNNKIYAIHTVENIDSTVAEQLGNRGRKYSTKLYIHVKKNENASFVLNKTYTDIYNHYMLLFKEIALDINSNELKYIDKKNESFNEYITWDEDTKKVSFAELKVSSDLYDIDRKNEFNHYNYYFRKKLEYYGWTIEFVEGISENDAKKAFTKQDKSTKADSIKTIIKKYKQYVSMKQGRLSEEGFVEYLSLSDDEAVKSLSQTLLMNVVHDYDFLSQHYSDEFIFKAIEDNTRQHKTFGRLYEALQRDIERNIASTVAVPSKIEWLYNNVTIGTKYNTDALELLIKRFNDRTDYFDKISSVSAMQKLLQSCFIVDIKKKQVNKVRQPITIIKGKLTVPPMKSKNYTQEDLINTQMHLEHLSHEEDPQSYIDTEDYEELLSNELEMAYNLSQNRPNVLPINKLNKWL